jgi:uncharacterized SAM-binding protein YcdF (DUF218 family)/glycosyltransferase involved in cell wall biosynthesis
MYTTKQDFIIFSSIDWSTHWQLHHQLTTSLISTGNNVLFVENTGIRSINMGDMGRLSERISTWRKSCHGFSSTNDNKLTIYSPILLPFPYSRLSLFVNKRIFGLSISRWIRSSNFRNPIVISFLPTPLIQSAIKTIDPVLTVYYCANNMAESSESASQIRPYEDYFFKRVNIVFTAAYVIQERAERFSEKVFYFPPGIDFDKFKAALDGDKIPDDIKGITGPIVGYIGTLGRVLDQELLCTLADQCIDFTIVLIGPEYTNIDALKIKSNIVFLGAKPHNQLPYYIKEFDVGIVPYLCNDFTEGVYPSKLNEYLAMGIPAVSTNLREVRESKEVYGETAVIADSAEEFVEAVKSLVVEKNNALLKKQRIKTAKANSWDSRFEGLSKIIRQELIEAELQQSGSSWKKKFNSYFNLQSKRRKIATAIMFSFFIILYSPLFWFFGEQLTVSDTLVKADAIVVFSGDGEVSYQNLSYQRRALDAIVLYNQGYSNKIFISSGREQTIADVELIRLFLISKGVSESSIYIHNKYPDSTYRNVLMVKKSLEENNVNSILFLTSPYHSLRAVLTWTKNAPNIDIIAPNIAFKSSQGVEWGIGVGKIKVIMYEYAAIIHNRLTGRIGLFR